MDNLAKKIESIELNPTRTEILADKLIQMKKDLKNIKNSLEATKIENLAERISNINNRD